MSRFYRYKHFSTLVTNVRRYPKVFFNITLNAHLLQHLRLWYSMQFEGKGKIMALQSICAQSRRFLLYRKTCKRHKLCKQHVLHYLYHSHWTQNIPESIPRHILYTYRAKAYPVISIQSAHSAQCLKSKQSIVMCWKLYFWNHNCYILSVCEYTKKNCDHKLYSKPSSVSTYKDSNTKISLAKSPYG